jgi:hypothetical protein
VRNRSYAVTMREDIYGVFRAPDKFNRLLVLSNRDVNNIYSDMVNSIADAYTYIWKHSGMDLQHPSYAAPPGTIIDRPSQRRILSGGAVQQPGKPVEETEEAVVMPGEGLTPAEVGGAAQQTTTEEWEDLGTELSNSDNRVLTPPPAVIISSVGEAEGGWTMAEYNEPMMKECGCEPFSEDSRALGCTGCSPTMYVTCDEEAILSEMRGIKEQVRPISDRLQEIEKLSGAGSSGEQKVSGSELTELKSQLADLRAQWRDWEKKLDQAIEQKLIILGHREQPL